MPDMPAVFHQASSPPKVDLASAHSQFFQVPASSSASSSLYSLSVSRKRPRRETEKITKFDFEAPITTSPLFLPSHQHAIDYHAAELDYRPNRYRESFLPPSLDGSVDSIAPEPLGTSRKRSRRDSCIASPSVEETPTSSRRPGWGRTVINAVGKVLDLCWTGAFKGFYAGGGQGYDMTAGSPTQITTTWQSPASEKDTPMPHTPIPGQYPEEDADRSWVVVPTQASDPFDHDDLASPSLKSRRVHQASSPRRRPAVMPKMAKRPSSAMRPSTPSRIPTASPRSKGGPASADMQRHAARMRRKEREEDASIQRLNKQLQAMIREGKEALGTTIEVDDIDMDFDSS
ncbi:hypothetical protein N7478_008403 [Penicillium angulare]|uniref:uncharacterized protein n=1 Tax=Penicillium angulare TaxID=116970 RepID=UPI002540A6FA|nr:uncharacterized protein N7478_008403 [Penicillium angulare]KAJ5273278.1 hypothetical protein N7478_008403 [Penicillium angulare]